MERRKHERIKRRLPCEVTCQGKTLKGVALDVSIGGLFVQVHAPLDPGLELDIQLRAPGASVRIPLRGVVARSRRVPARLAALEAGGVGVRILNAPPAYYEMIAGMATPAEAVRPAPPKPARRADLPPLFSYRVRVKQTDGPRSRTLVIPAESPEQAQVRARKQLDTGWKVLEVDPDRLLRVETELEILVASKTIESSGTLVDLSLTGAHLDDVERRPREGSRVRARVFASPSGPVTLTGKVSRLTSRGFAMKFTEVGDDVKRLVSELASDSASRAAG